MIKRLWMAIGAISARSLEQVLSHRWVNITVFMFFLSAAAIQAQSPTDPVWIQSITRTNGNLRISWQGAIPPYKLQMQTNLGPWIDVTFHIYGYSYVTPASPFSTFYRVRTVRDITAPAIPSAFVGVPDGCNRALLGWQALPCPDPRWCADNNGGTGLKGYKLYRNGGFLQEVLYPLTTAIDATVTASTTNVYTLSSIDRSGNESARTPAVTVITPACGGGGTGNRSVTLAWDPNIESDLAGYTLRYGRATGTYTNSVTLSTVTNATVATLQAGATYFFVVTARNTSGLESDLSNEVSYTP